MAKPVKEFSAGKTKAAVFKNEQYNSYSFKFQKSYKDKDGNWQNTEYFTPVDLRDLHMLVGFLLDKQVKERAVEQQAPPEPVPDQGGDDKDLPF